jgi:hypothetical protein
LSPFSVLVLSKADVIAPHNKKIVRLSGDGKIMVRRTTGDAGASGGACSLGLGPGVANAEAAAGCTGSMICQSSDKMMRDMDNAEAFF